MRRNTALDRLFEKWPGKGSDDFHRDGIINERRFESEPVRLLFVMAEPSSRGPRYAYLSGRDLREVYDAEAPQKELTHNVALWTQVLLDGRKEYVRLSAKEVQESMRRIAVVNLKKTAGHGRGNYRLIRQCAFKDRPLLEEQIRIIRADHIVACGAKVHNIMAEVLSSSPHWSKVAKANHPSLWPVHAPRAFHRVVELQQALSHRIAGANRDVVSDKGWAIERLAKLVGASKKAD